MNGDTAALLRQILAEQRETNRLLRARGGWELKRNPARLEWITLGQQSLDDVKAHEDARAAEGETCPMCGAAEVFAPTPRTVYACGSSDYDGRPGTFRQECCSGEEPADDRPLMVYGRPIGEAMAMTAADDRPPLVEVGALPVGAGCIYNGSPGTIIDDDEDDGVLGLCALAWSGGVLRIHREKMVRPIPHPTGPVEGDRREWHVIWSDRHVSAASKMQHPDGYGREDLRWWWLCPVGEGESTAGGRKVPPC